MAYWARVYTLSGRLQGSSPRQTLKRLVGSNPTPSASLQLEPVAALTAIGPLDQHSGIGPLSDDLHLYIAIPMAPVQE